MKIKSIQSNLKLILLTLLCAFALNFSAFADNKVVTSSLTESGTSYNDSDPDLSALHVSGEGITYNGTEIFLSASANHTATGIAGHGAHVESGGILLLADSTITVTGSYGHGAFINTSTGTLNNVTIATEGYSGRGLFVSVGASLSLSESSITTKGVTSHGVYLSTNSTGTLNRVIIETQENSAYGVYVHVSATLSLIDGDISTFGNNAYGVSLNNYSSGTISNVNIDTQGSVAHGVYVQPNSGVSLADSDIRVTGSGAYGFCHSSLGTSTVQMDGNTLSGTGVDGGSIYAAAGLVTLTGSNGSVITGDVRSQSGATLNIILTDEGTELRGDFTQGSTSVINLTLGTGALLAGSGVLDSLTLENGVTIGYTGDAITVTDSIIIDGAVTFDLSELAATGEYDLIDWSRAGNVNVGSASFNFTGAGVEGNFSVAGTKLTFNANAVPEPSIYFLMSAGLGALLLVAHYRRKVQTGA